MGIREQLNQNPGITTGVTIGIIVIALGFIVWQLFGGTGTSTVTEMYYTVDDGKTYFADDATKVAPFEHDGKEAVRCYVYRCADGNEFVAYLERMTKEAKVKYEAAVKAQQGGTDNGQAMMEAEMLAVEGTEVKKPGDAKWTKRQTAEGEKVTTVNCPDGNNAKLEFVLP